MFGSPKIHEIEIPRKFVDLLIVCRVRLRTVCRVRFAVYGCRKLNQQYPPNSTPITSYDEDNDDDNGGGGDDDDDDDGDDVIHRPLGVWCVRV